MSPARILRVALAGLLGLSAALLVSACAGSNAKLIPVADAGPLQSDFEAVAQEAEAGNGSCTTTQAAIAKTEQDFNELPATVDAGLRNTLRQGIDNLRSHALALCAQSLAQASVTSTTANTTPSHTTATTTTETQTTPAQTTPATTTPETETNPGGGTPAPGETPAGGVGEQGGGTGVGASSPQGENGSANNPIENGAGAGGPGAAGKEAER
jgi:hypothetical protein